MQAAVTLDSARNACSTSRAASASWNVSAAVLFRDSTSDRVVRFSAIDCFKPARSNAPIGTMTRIAVTHAVATSNPVSLWRIDQSRNGFIGNTPTFRTSFNDRFRHAQKTGAHMQPGLRGGSVIHLEMHLVPLKNEGDDPALLQEPTRLSNRQNARPLQQIEDVPRLLRRVDVQDLAI